jgi:hypothetical protein
MNTQADKTYKSNNKQSVASQAPAKTSGSTSTFPFIDNRPEARVQRKLQEMAINSGQGKLLCPIQEISSNSQQSKQAVQRQHIQKNEDLARVPNVVQRNRTVIYSEGNDVWVYNDVTQCLLKNDVVLFSDIADITEARKLMLDRVRSITSNDLYSEEDDDDVFLEGDKHAQMLDTDQHGHPIVEQDDDDVIVFDGEFVTDNISEGGSVFSGGASTCVIVIMVGVVDGDEIAVCRHFSAGTPHFTAPQQYVQAMTVPLQGAPNIEVYVVGGVEGGDYDMEEDFLALAQALSPYDIVVFRVPAFDEDDNPDDIASVEASYSKDGFQWKYEYN